MNGAISKTAANTLQPSTGGAPEKQVVSDIILYLSINGWIADRIEQQRHMKKGMPDIVAGKHGRAIWIEAKARPGKWMDRSMRTKTLKAGMQRPGQRMFQLRWQDHIPYMLANSWEQVHDEIIKLSFDK
jgi:hypothetical protein